MLNLRTTIAATLLGAATGCTSMRPVLSPAPFIADKHPHLVLVVDKDSSIVPIAGPRLEGDSVLGMLPGYGEPIGVSLPEARQVLAPQPDHKRTAMLVAGLGLVTGTVVYFATRPGGGTGCAQTGIYGTPVC